MRNFRILAVLATVALATAGCKGDKGDPGQNGTNGSNGAAGSTALVSVDAAPAANCANGGSRIQVGLDANGNGTLDAAEVNASATTYVCNGAAGAAGADGSAGSAGAAGVSTLVNVSPEAAGVNCATGGQKIETGLDNNPANGTLDAAEIAAGSTSYTCNGAGGLVGPAGPTGPQGAPGVSLQSTGLNVAVVSVSTTTPIQVRFTLKDDRGYPIDVQGVYSLNVAMSSSLRFALARVVTAGGQMQPYAVLTPGSASGAAFSPGTITGSITGASRTIVENGSGAGDYTFTFPSHITYASGAANDTFTLWIQATRQMDADDTTNPKTFWAKNVEYNYIPVGTGTPLRRQLVTTANCNKCHRGFTPEGSTGNAFHGAGRVEAPFCNVCHNVARTSNPAADSVVFVHRIHNSKMLQAPETLTTGTATRGSQGATACTEAAPCTCTVASPCVFNGNAFHEIEVTYPQDVRNCAMCHAGAAQDQSVTGASQKACGSCHDYVSFSGSQAVDCSNPVTLDGSGLPARCNHAGGTPCESETACGGVSCTTCHTAGSMAGKHRPVAPPDPNNVYLGGTNGNTNAAWMVAAGNPPAGASTIRYVLATDAVSLTTVGGQLRPTIKFKFTLNGTDVVFPTYDAATAPELIPNFVGSPSVYFAYAVPQDGIATPADFNVTASGYLKNIWKGTATGTGAGTLTGPDASGFYTVVLTGVSVPANATMFTGGLGYTYGLGSATNSPPFANNTQPFTQTNVPGFTYTANACTGTNNYCGGTGGLINPIPNVWQTLSVSTGTATTGFGGSGANTACSVAAPCTCTATNPCFPTGVRRAIVSNQKCHDCHAPLGVEPSFHAGQRNDGPTCSFCHNPNRTSSAWSANGKDAIHAIHGARKRAAAYAWHAITPTQTFAEVTFPGELNNCTACHVADTFDFSATASARAVDNLLWSTVGQGRYDNRAAFNPSSWFTISPYVVADRSVDYGYGFATSNVSYTLPDGISGTQGGVACTPAAPCACTAANPCTIDVAGTVVVQGVTVTFQQGSPAVNCTAGAPCTCTTAAPCTGRVATCTTAAPCEAQGTTLVKSPITSACSACHDTALAIDHMQAMGGSFYTTRASSIGAADGVSGPTQEQCMLCHAKGKIAAIRDVHK